MAVHLRVREIAEAKGFNQASLARASGLGFTTVRRLWHKPRQEVSTKTLERLARALGVSIADLLEEEPDPS